MPFQKGNKIGENTRFKKGHKHSTESKVKISQSLMGNKRALGQKWSEESKRKISLIHKGRKTSEKTRSKMRKAQKGAKGNNWKGGRLKTNGRILILTPEHPFAQKRGYIFQSRLVIEKKLGRYLKREEVVHHINGIIDDDSLDNLQLFPNSKEHMKFHYSMR